MEVPPGVRPIYRPLSYLMCMFCCLVCVCVHAQAFMRMFQLLNQEGWVAIMHETMLASGTHVVPLVAAFFVLTHLVMIAVSGHDRNGDITRIGDMTRSIDLTLIGGMTLEVAT